MPATLIWPQRSLGSSCQTGQMAALLNSLFLVFKISFLPKYRVIGLYYIVKWYSNWCISLDMFSMLALRANDAKHNYHTGINNTRVNNIRSIELSFVTR